MLQARWEDILSYFNYKVIYRPGTANVRADRLSRRPDYTKEENILYESIFNPRNN